MPMPQSPEVIVDRRLSPPDQIVLTQNGCRNSGCHDDSDDCRSNTGKMAVPILHQEEELGDGEEGGRREDGREGGGGRKEEKRGKREGEKRGRVGRKGMVALVVGEESVSGGGRKEGE